MTESLSDPRASQSFVIVSRAQMNALHSLLFELIRISHEHALAGHLERPTAARMHKLLAAFEGAPASQEDSQ